MVNIFNVIFAFHKFTPSFRGLVLAHESYVWHRCVIAQMFFSCVIAATLSFDIKILLVFKKPWLVFPQDSWFLFQQDANKAILKWHFEQDRAKFSAQGTGSTTSPSVESGVCFPWSRMWAGWPEAKVSTRFSTIISILLGQAHTGGLDSDSLIINMEGKWEEKQGKAANVYIFDSFLLPCSVGFMCDKDRGAEWKHGA